MPSILYLWFWLRICYDGLTSMSMMSDQVIELLPYTGIGHFYSDASQILFPYFSLLGKILILKISF